MPCIDELQDILVSLPVARAGGIGMRQLVHEHQAGLARKNRIKVHLLERLPAVLQAHAGHELDARRQLVRFPSLVAFQVADDDVEAFFFFLPSLFEHGKGLADPRGHAEENFELPFSALLPFGDAEKSIRIGSSFFNHRGSSFCRQEYRGRGF